MSLSIMLITSVSEPFNIDAAPAPAPLLIRHLFLSAGLVIEDVIIPLGAKPLEANGEAASIF